jgi:hypothetical protein
MKTRLFYLLLSLFILSGSFAFGQSVSIKSASGNGPVISGLKIKDAKAVGNLREMGSMLATPVAGSDEVEVRFSFGRITQYRYNGKTYNSEEFNGECKYSCWDCSAQKVKVTATIKAGGKNYTESGIEFTLTGLFHFTIKLPGMVKRNTISLVNLTVEGIAYPEFEKLLQQYEKCLKKKKEKKEKQKKETATDDDDWWNGKNEKPEKRKIVLNGSDADWWNGKDSKEEKPKSKNVSDADWWNGENENTDADKKKQDKFRVVNEYSQYNRNNEDKYSWVEDANGNIIIPKGKYYIESFEDGLAQVEVLIRTDYYGFVKDKKVQLFERCFMDENGNKLPPKTYSLSYEHYYKLLVLWDKALSDAEIAEIKREWKEKDENAHRQLKSIYSGQGYNID